MLDLFELERLFSNWLKKRCSYTAEVIPRFSEYGGLKKITVEIYRVSGKNKTLITTVSSQGKNMENIWDNIFDKMFEYFMSVAKNVE